MSARRPLPTLGLVLVFALLAASRPALLEAQARSAAPAGEMTWGVHVSLAPVWFDPAEHTGIITVMMVLYAVHDAVVKPMPGNPLAPSLAESWTMSKDGLVYEFVVRKGVVFHNGDALTADDVKFSFERYRGAAAKLLKDKVAAVEVVDPYRVRFRLKEPWPDFMTFYGSPASGAAWIVPKKYVEKVGDDGFKKAPVGAGPYKLTSFNPGVEIVLDAFDRYWRKTPAVKRLVWKSVPEDLTRLAMLKRGEVDVAYSLRGPLGEEVKKTPGLKLVGLVGNATQWLNFGAPMWDPKSPWHDKRVRLAAALAFDKDGINQAETLGLSRPTGSIIPSAYEYALAIPAYPYDPPRAKKLLAEAGYPNGFDAVLRVAPTYYYTVRSAEVLVSQFAKVGIRAKIEQIEWGQWLSQVWKDANYDMSIIGHAEAWDIGNFANPKYYFRWDNADFQKLFKESEVTVDDKKRRELYVKMQQMLADEAPAVWLYMHPRLVVTKKGVTGIWKDLPIPSLDLSEVGWQR
jgi:peptide/nickel transport system substrate-binding protein